MTLNDVMAVTLRYFTEFGTPRVECAKRNPRIQYMRSTHSVVNALQHNRVDLWRNLCTSLMYFVVRVLCRRKESSRSLSHLLVEFLV